MNSNNAPAEISSSPPEADIEILDDFTNKDASLNKLTSTNFDDLQHLICNTFGFCETIYKRVVGKNDFKSYFI